MGITDELRRYISGPARSGISHICEKAITNIADKIDQAHQREVTMARGEAVAMPNHRIALPRDADGVPIELGDEVWHIENATEHFTVTFFTLDEDGWKVNNHKPSKLLHWEEPTVDVLLIQFVINASGTKSVTELNALVDDYAERIREAVEHE